MNRRKVLVKSTGRFAFGREKEREFVSLHEEKASEFTTLPSSPYNGSHINSLLAMYDSKKRRGRRKL
jgi:hypothetical protein